MMMMIIDGNLLGLTQRMGELTKVDHFDQKFSVLSPNINHSLIFLNNCEPITKTYRRQVPVMQNAHALDSLYYFYDQQPKGMIVIFIEISPYQLKSKLSKSQYIVGIVPSIFDFHKSLQSRLMGTFQTCDYKRVDLNLNI